MKFGRSNKFDLCYYGLKQSVASKWASEHLLGVPFILLLMEHYIPFLNHKKWQGGLLITVNGFQKQTYRFQHFQIKSHITAYEYFHQSNLHFFSFVALDAITTLTSPA